MVTDVVSEGSTLMGFPCDSVGKESCSAGDPGVIFWVGKIHCESNRVMFDYLKQPNSPTLGFPDSSVGQVLHNAGDLSSILEFGKDPVEKERIPTAVLWPGGIPQTVPAHGLQRSQA